MQKACAVSYCHLWRVRFYHIFPHYLTNSTNFGEKLFNIKCVFCFSLQLLSETFIILRSIQRDVMTLYKRLHVKYSLQLSDFSKICIFSTELRKYSNNRFDENPSSRSRVVLYGRTDGRTRRSPQSLVAVLRTRLRIPSSAL